MRYQYTSAGFQTNNTNPVNITKGVKLLILTNVIIFFIIEISGQRDLFLMNFGLVPLTILNDFKIWQIFTYMFLHGGILHILFNMVILWIFGKDLELSWGKNNFLYFYFICGIGSGFITFLFNMHSFIPVVGASGAIYGLLVAYGFSYPNRIIYLYGVFPLRVKYLILGLGFIAFFASISTSTSNISHLTHLAGMIIGAGYIIIKHNYNFLRLSYIKIKIKFLKKIIINHTANTQNIKIKMDQILDKINEKGWDSLSAQEEDFLKNINEKDFKNNHPN